MASGVASDDGTGCVFLRHWQRLQVVVICCGSKAAFKLPSLQRVEGHCRCLVLQGILCPMATLEASALSWAVAGVAEWQEKAGEERERSGHGEQRHAEGRARRATERMLGVSARRSGLLHTAKQIVRSSRAQRGVGP